MSNTREKIKRILNYSELKNLGKGKYYLNTWSSLWLMLTKLIFSGKMIGNFGSVYIYWTDAEGVEDAKQLYPCYNW